MDSLYNLLNEHVLTEGRKEDVMAKYPNVPKEAIEQLSQQDPSGNNKYLEYMVKSYSEGRTDISEVIEIVTNFNNKLSLMSPQNIQDYINTEGDNWGSNKSNLEKFKKSPKDINIYPSLAYVNHFISFLNTVVTKKKEADEMKKEQDRVYEDSEILITSPKTHRASCHYGRHSAWCVATSNTGHFANYTKNGTLYFFISKKDIAYTKWWKDKDGGEPPYKTALLLKDNGDASWWSKGDSNYTNGLTVGNKDLPFLTQEMVDKILNHSRYVIENRKKREIERILISKGFYKRGGGDSQSRQDFAGFVKTKIFTPEQIVTIIRNDNWLALYENSETGKEVRQQLGSQVVYSLLREMISSVPNLLETLKDIHSQEFLTSVGETFGEEENKGLAELIKERLGKKPTAAEVGSDVKMYVDKWTMTPEAWEIYNNSSSYFFIGKVEPMEVGTNDNGEPVYEKTINIENLTKGDRFNPKDHHALQMMMLRAKMQQASLYALVTDKEVLDKFVGKGGNEIPAEIRKTIMERAKKLG